MLKPDESNGILLNTPNRKEILNDGPPQNCQSNLLGKGAYGVVFKAIFCEKPVAVKIVKNQEYFNQQMLLNEANIMDLSHRNIMRILKIESTPKYGIIIMERFEGQCLQSILDSMALPLMHRILISLDILAAVAFCHEHDLLHLDVKPQNVFVCYEKRNRIIANNMPIAVKYLCKLCDFGASTLVHKSQQQQQSQQQRIQGTVRYMSPEVLRADLLTPAADIYSLGITMWQLKYRQMPYFWIQCNDIVAYRVVKYQLRPDARSQLLMPLSAHGEQNNENGGHCCQCESTVSENSPSCVQEVSSVLHEKGLKSLNAVQVDRTNSSSLKRKRVFRELNLNTNNINENATKKIVKAAEYVENDNFRLLKEMFLQHNNKNNSSCVAMKRNGNFKLAEATFIKVYQSCWHSDKQARPLARDVRKQLIKLLLSL